MYKLIKAAQADIGTWEAAIQSAINDVRKHPQQAVNKLTNLKKQIREFNNNLGAFK